MHAAARSLATLVFAFLFAGCFGGSNTPAGSSSTSGSPDATNSQGPATTSDVPGSTATPSGGPTENSPPVAALEASIDNGSLPLLVNFTITASDSDGDDLSYTFQPLGNDTEEEQGAIDDAGVTTNYTYEAVGLYNATLTVSDGANETVQTIQINVTGSATGATQDFSGSTTVSLVGCPEATVGFFDVHAFDPYPGGALEGKEWLKFTIDPATRGEDYSWTDDFTVPVVWGSAIAFYDSSDALVFYSWAADKVPATAAYAVIYPCGPGPDTVTYHAGPAAS